ncbi:MAG: hypothetical protein AB7R89_25895 [Dehalococcoidia bacterium]
MKLAIWKRTTLGTMVALSLAAALGTLSAGQASAGVREDTFCHRGSGDWYCDVN